MKVVSKIIYGIVLLICVVAIIHASVQAFEFYTRSDSARTLTLDGRVEEYETTDSDDMIHTGYTYYLSYTYEVDGVEYSSEDEMVRADEYDKAMEAGEITIYYMKDTPEISFSAKSVAAETLICSVLFGGLFGAFSLWGLFPGLFKRHRKNPQGTPQG